MLRPLSLSSSCVPPCDFGWSSSHFVTFCFLFGLTPLWVLARGGAFLMSRVSAPCVWGFPVVSLLFSFRAPLLSFLPLGASCDVGVPSASLLSGAFWWLSLSSVCGALSFFYPGFPAISLVLPLSLLVFILFLMLPRLPLRLFLPLLCLSVGASWCVSSYGFVVGGASCFLVLCCGCCLFAFLRVFTSCYRFVGLFSS